MIINEAQPDVILSNMSVNNNSTATSTGVTLEHAIYFSVGYAFTFNASAALGAYLELYADPAGANQNFSIGAKSNYVFRVPIAVPSGGGAVDGLVAMPAGARFVKVLLRNRDTGAGIAIVGAYLYSHVKTA